MNDEYFKKSVNAALAAIKQTLDHHTELLNKHTDIIENQLLPSVLETENTIKVYGDMYKLNNDNMKRLEKRIEPLEDKAGIQPPLELTLAEVQ